MPSDSPIGQPVFRGLDRPRPLSPAEQSLLSWLAAAVGLELSAQADAPVVAGECTCGCSSVQLASRSAPLTQRTIERLSDSGRSDYLAVRSTGRSRDGHLVDVVLHVVEGRVHELEIFDPHAGEGVAVDPAGLTALDAPQVG